MSSLSLVSDYRLSIINATSKVFGIFVPILLAYFVGLNHELEILIYFYGIIIFISNLVIPAIEATLVPIYHEVSNQKDLFSGIFGYLIMTILLIAIFFILLFYNANVVPSFSKEDEVRISFMIILCIPLLLVAVYNSMLSSIANSEKNYTANPISFFIKHVTLLLTFSVMYLTLNVSIWTSLIVSLSLGEIIRYIFLINLCSLRPYIRFKYALFVRAGTKFYERIFFPLVGSLFFSANVLIDRTMATLSQYESSITALFLADRIQSIVFYSLVSALLVTSITVMATSWGHSSKVLIEKAKSIMHRSMRDIAVVSLIIIFMMYVVYSSATHYFDLKDQFYYYLFITTAGYCLTFAPAIGASILSRVLVQIKLTKVILTASIISLLINALLNYYWVKLFGIFGIIMSTIFVHIFVFFLYYYFVSSEYRKVT